MLAVLSPAKKLNEDAVEHAPNGTTPALMDDINELVSVAKTLSEEQLSSLMGISDKLSSLNRERYEAMETPFTEENAMSAAFLFDGDTYSGLDARTLDGDDLIYAQGSVRILSGLYGVVRPLDLIQPYRLEMGTKLENPRGSNLYEFWGTRLADELNAALEGHDERVIVHLASKEYFKAVDADTLDAKVLNCRFLEVRDGEPRFISFYAKKARGLMARYIVRNRVESTDELKKFDYESYAFSEERSTEDELVFVRPDSRS